MENQLSSWKVSSVGPKTVVVLRLTDLTSMAEHSSTDGSRRVNKTETKKEQENTANVLVNKKNVRRTD